MPRRRRRIIANQPFELCFRTKTGLPFPPNDVINLILESGIAYANRNQNVTICAYLWMGNHPHMIVIPKDAAKFVRFYAELEKYLTEAVKRLLGIDLLILWEGRPNVAQFGDINAVIKYSAYLYANPSRAHLVDRIELYPGVSSYKAFTKHLSGKVDSKHTRSIPFIRVNSIEPLGTRTLTPSQARVIVQRLIEGAEEHHLLEVEPNAWMRSFGVQYDEVHRINKEIFDTLRSQEEVNRKERLKLGYSTFGVEKLKLEPILKPHIPKKKERKIFFLASTFELRKHMLETFEAFCSICRECYLSYKAGNSSVTWPPGSFRPPLPALANAIA